jgi:hypothetical protein
MGIEACEKKSKIGKRKIIKKEKERLVRWLISIKLIINKGFK